MKALIYTSKRRFFKNATGLFALMFCLALSSNAQDTLYSENFNSGSSSTWTLNAAVLGCSNSTGGNFWTINNVYTGDAEYIVPTPNEPSQVAGSPNSYYMHINNADNSGIQAYSACANEPASGNFLAEMNTDISTLGDNNVTFSFWYVCVGNTNYFGELYYSTNGGTTWTQESGEYYNDSSWKQAVITDPAFSNQSKLRFAFMWLQNDGSAGADPAFAVDDISLTYTCTPSVTISPAPVASICSGTDITFTASPTNGGSAPTYKWSVNGALVSGVSGNTYTTASLSNGAIVSCQLTSNVACAVQKTATSGNTTVVVYADPTATITAGGATTFCKGGTVELTAKKGSGYRYQWSNGATTQSIVVNTTGSYLVTVSNANGCSKVSAAKKVTVDALPKATITATGSTTLCNGSSVTLTANTGADFTYAWSNSATTGAITVTTVGSYIVTVTNKNECSQASHPTVITECLEEDAAGKSDNDGVSDGNATSSIGNATFDVSVYPNPYSGGFHLKVNSGSNNNLSIKIFDVMGRVLDEQKEVPFGTDVILGNGYAAGVYLVQVNQNETTKVMRVIKSE